MASISYFCPQYSWIFKMYFYCRGGLRQVPVKFQRGNISIKDSQLKLENPNSKGGNTRTVMIKHPNGQFDIGKLRWNSNTRFHNVLPWKYTSLWKEIWWLSRFGLYWFLVTVFSASIKDVWTTIQKLKAFCPFWCQGAFHQCRRCVFQ